MPPLKHPLLATLLLLMSSLAHAALPESPVPLWPNGATPGALGNADRDIPTLTPFLPDGNKATGAAFVVCPGGGYSGLADHEGSGYARWLADHGVAAFVLKYRLGSSGYHHPTMLLDVSRALRLTRSRASQWRIDPQRIGIIGSSAGGHLAATLLTHFDAGKPDSADPVERVSSRPDLGVLCYAVISMSGDLAHGGSRANLLGPNPSPELMNELSAEKQVKPDTAPCFIWHTGEDGVVKVENALAFAAALRAKNVPFELHVYEKLNHGIGLGKGDAPGGYHRWTSDLTAWLQERGWMRK